MPVGHGMARVMTPIEVMNPIWILTADELFFLISNLILGRHHQLHAQVDVNKQVVVKKEVVAFKQVALENKRQK